MDSKVMDYIGRINRLITILQNGDRENYTDIDVDYMLKRCKVHIENLKNGNSLWSDDMHELNNFYETIQKIYEEITI